jgi:hypothetical protein
MDAGLLGMFLAIRGDGYRFDDNQSRTVFCNLLIKFQLAIRHRTIGITVPKLDRGKNKSIRKLYIP